MNTQTYTITQTEMTAPARWQLTLHSENRPPFAIGQFFLAQIADPFVAYLRRAVFPIPADDDPTALQLVFSAADLTDPAIGWLASRRAGTTVNLLGALGNGFSLPNTARNILLVGDSTRISLLMALANIAAQRGQNVTLALHLPGKRYIPRTELHPAVELLLVTDDGSGGYRGEFFQRLNPLIQWADALAAVGTRSFYRTLKTAITAIHLFPIDGYAQVLLTDAPLHICGTGVCGRCTVPTAHGTKLACVAGPVFNLAEVLLDD